MNLTDTHCHLYFDSYQADLAAVLERAQDAGISRIMVPAIDLTSCRQVIDLVDQYEFIYGAVGVHPNSASTWNQTALDVLSDLVEHPRVVAIGEIGLDYYRDRTPREVQKELLLQQLDLALDHQLPAILHVRNASENDRSCITDLLEVLEEWIGRAGRAYDLEANPPGVIHSFSGSPQESQRAQKAGCYLGVTGPITYKNSAVLQEVVRQADPSRLLVETDGPFLSPQQQRGKRNEPAHVRYIVDKISEVTGRSASQVAEQTAANAQRLFKLSLIHI